MSHESVTCATTRIASQRTSRKRVLWTAILRSSEGGSMRRFGAATAIVMVIALLPSSAGASVTKGQWKLERTPNPPRVGNAYLYSVACPKSRECLAVGTYQRKDSFAYMTLAESW